MDIKTLNAEFQGAQLASASLDENDTLTLLFRTGTEGEVQVDKNLLIENVDEEDITGD